MCPTMHFNYRYFETDGGVWWFGGGTDITPAYLDEVSQPCHALPHPVFHHCSIKTACRFGSLPREVVFQQPPPLPIWPGTVGSLICSPGIGFLRPPPRHVNFPRGIYNFSRAHPVAENSDDYGSSSCLCTHTCHSHDCHSQWTNELGGTVSFGHIRL